MTPETQKVLRQGLAYRNEGISQSPDVNQPIADIIDFEINELENDDILDYMQEHGMITKANISASHQYIKDYFQKPIDQLYGLWLADKEAVIDPECYGETTGSGWETDITTYDLSTLGEYLIIDDLGYDSFLLVLDNPNRPGIIE